MVELDKTTQSILDVIDGLGFKQEGAFNLRYNGSSACYGNSENIRIEKKTDKQGIDIYVSSKADGDEVHIPVVVNTDDGFNDEVYNDFFIEAGANVVIVAGCGLHNSGCNEARHSGIHSFHVGKNAVVTYQEKHYGEGNGLGTNVLDPVTNIFLDEGSVFNLDTAQIKGVDSTLRKTYATLGPNSKFIVTERLMTHGTQTAQSDMQIVLDGEGSSAQIISRSVAREKSSQIFHPDAIGMSKCSAHVQCDSIIMDEAMVSSIPQIEAKNVNAAIVHEAAIGRINDEQLQKLRTLGLTESEAEGVIIDAFLQ